MNQHSVLLLIQQLAAAHFPQFLPTACAAMEGGHINDTYLVTCQHKKSPLVFQKLNTAVFARPEAVMENIALISAHIHTRCPGEPFLYFHNALDGKNYAYVADGSFWRVMDFAQGMDAPSKTAAVIRGTGAAFGRFQRLLSDFDSGRLTETIPGFHDTRRRFRSLFIHAAEDPLQRAQSVQEELCFLEGIRETACRLSDSFAAGKLPRRVTHNDAKYSNVRFGQDGSPRLVLDLDTVMEGMAAYDYADGVRSLCGGSGVLDPAAFRVFTEGYLAEAGAFLTREERESLVPAVFSVTAELAVRYLEDHLTGAGYFREAYPGQSLAKARQLITLAKDIRLKQDSMHKMAAEIVFQGIF